MIVGRGNKVSVGIASEVAVGEGLSSGIVGEANSSVEASMVSPGAGGAVGVDVFISGTRVGSCVGVADTHAVNSMIELSVIDKRLNIIRL